MSQNNSDLGAFLAGFIIGGLVGAATAVILAPQSGEDTRSQLLNRSETLRQTGNERIQQYREQAGTYTGTAFSTARDQASRVQEQARIVLDSGKERAGQVRNQVNTFVKRENGSSNS